MLGDARASRRASRSPTAPCATPRTCRCREDVDAYFKREVLPHAPDAWIDHEKTKVGYEIPFNRHFYVFEPPRDWPRSTPTAEGDRPDQGDDRGAGGVSLPSVDPAVCRGRAADRCGSGARLSVGQHDPDRPLLAGRRLHQPEDRQRGVGRRRRSAAAAHIARTHPGLRGFTRVNLFRMRQFLRGISGR